MGYMTDGLTFNTLRRANMKRLPQFRNNKGDFAHTKEDGSDWTPNDWMVAVLGELGEAANVMKKIRRGDLTLEEAKPKLIQEYADIIIYLDILSSQLDINLGEAVIETFNNKSIKVGSPVRIDANDWYNVREAEK